SAARARRLQPRPARPLHAAVGSRPGDCRPCRRDRSHPRAGEPLHRRRAGLPGAGSMTAETSNARGEWVLVPRELLEEARNIAMEWTLKGRVPECGQFGQIAQDLDAMLAAAQQPPIGGDVAMEAWHAAVNDAGELRSNAPDERYARRAANVESWIKANRPAPPSAPVGVEGLPAK